MVTVFPLLFYLEDQIVDSVQDVRKQIDDIWLTIQDYRVNFLTLDLIQLIQVVGDHSSFHRLLHPTMPFLIIVSCNNVLYTTFLFYQHCNYICNLHISTCIVSVIF